VGSHPQYDTFADDFLEHAHDGFANAYFDRPACLDLLGEVAGRTVLDAACGPGLYAEELVNRGATVTGLDISSRMVELARERVPGAVFATHDLNNPLPLPDNSVDLVLFALALEHLDNRVQLFGEFNRVLRKAGALVFSRMHPTGDWLRHGGSYWDVRVVEEVWSKGWQVRYWLAPLERTCAELRAGGFLIERLLEPRPLPAGEALSPEEYERLQREPRGFLAIRAIPDSRAQ
jgi:SAM-dependent methyltransferase